MIEEQKILPEPKNQLDKAIAQLEDPTITASELASLRKFAEVAKIRDIQALDDVRKRLKAVQWAVENGKLTDDPEKTEVRFQGESVLNDLGQNAERTLVQSKSIPPFLKKESKFGKWDGEMQMFVVPVHSVNMNTLRFIRWKVENGLEHEIAGPPAGEYAGEQPKTSLPDNGIIYKSPSEIIRVSRPEQAA